MIQKFREESRLLDRQIKELEMKLRKAPGGELKCARNGTGVKWYYYKDTSRRTYLPKQNRTLAEKLALKKYNLTALYMNRVPYRYESKLDLAGYGIFFPDFLIYHPRLLKLYYWEHFGMMDDEDYIHKAYRKLEIYTRNGIVPMDNLIATYETRTNPLDPGIVEKIIWENFL